MTPENNPYRLDRTVVPSAYRIFITPNLEEATFVGRVEIDVDIESATKVVKLNAIELDLSAATVTTGGTAHRSIELSLDEEYEVATYTFDPALPIGAAVLEIAFSGILNDQLHGFYRSTFTDPSGVKHTIATTQFENCDARRAFPCWDEPAFKATYQVNLTVPSHLAAYSNNPVSSDTDLGNGQRTVSFTPTMKMSTYLVAFIIGAFEETEAVDVDGVPLRIVFPIGNAHLAAHALEAGEFGLRFFAEYFDIPYPGEKMDMVAIPDFMQGAMENLGCITYRTSDLLIDPATASLAEMERVALVVLHELAHMWFGDLVTMEWWQGIWLNEAFATFMQVLCQDKFRPQWDTWTSFCADRDMALDIDGLHTTRSVEYEVVSPADTQGMFGRLTYEKGAAVLRMLEQYLGAETYRDGIRNYLRTHSYANTVTTDLWDAIEEVSGAPVRDVMNTWILQGGYPLITLQDGLISQVPFAYGPATGESAIGSSWKVPVMTRSLKGGAVSVHLLEDDAIAISDDPPVVLNARGSGYYRSRYGVAESAALADHVDELDAIERAVLLSDSWALLFSSQISADQFLTIGAGLGDLDEPTPWDTLATAVGYIKRALPDEQLSGFVERVRAIFEPQFARLGWAARPGESALAPQLRAMVLSTLGTVCRDEEIRAEASKRFDANQVSGDLANAILRIVSSQDRPGDYETFLERFRNADTPQDEQRYMRGLAGFSVESAALDAAERCFSEFRNQDGSTIFGLLTSNAKTGPSVWRYMASRWDDVLAKFPPNTLSYTTRGIVTFINDAALADEVEAFHESHPLAGEQKEVQQNVERMRVGLTFAAAMREQF
ncbi:MAG: M1 family metallopeptidase [Acidimicrobiales bacterium]|jgi:puromycin-sensitive aminopeptidase